MACDHASFGDAHDLRVLAQSDVELKRSYRDVLRQWNPQGSSPEEAAAAADRYMEDTRHVSSP